MGVLDDRVAIVTGSARGIGRATAELLSEHGAKVLINDLDGDVAEETASQISGETVVYAGDLTAAGAPDELVQSMLDIHNVVPFRVLRAAAPHLREPAKQERDEGREVFRKVVNVSSI